MKMNKKIVLMVVLAFISFQIPSNADYSNHGEKFQDVLELIEKEYYDSDLVDKDELFKIAVQSMLNSLDPYSTFMENKDLKDFMNEVNNHYEGIGVLMHFINGQVVVKQVFKDGPADKNGVKSGDIFFKVDGKDVSEMNTMEIASLVRGKKGSSVNIEFKRGNEIIEKDIIRSEVVMAPVREEKISDHINGLSADKVEKIGYIVLDTFSNDVHIKLRPIMEKLKDEGKNNIILDLRDNGGGDVFSAVKTAEYFTDKGPVLILKDNAGGENKYLGAGKKGDKNIVILINSSSASASEFVAGSAQEDGVKIVGETSYGKGVAQTIKKLQDGDSVKLTEYSFYTGEGKEINKIGIKPDFEVLSPELINTKYKFHLNDKYDEVLTLEKALNYLGYNVVPDDIYDYNTFEIIKKIQEKNNTYPYGVFDYFTQKMINEMLVDDYKNDDRQLRKAVEVLMEEME